MAKSGISELVTYRQYSELEAVAESFIKKGDWQGFVTALAEGPYSRGTYGYYPTGKVRDAIVHLLQLESVGGTDTDVMGEFRNLAGRNLDEVRVNALDHAITLLRDQIENRHTYFLDVEAMASSPFAVLVEEVLAARRKELEMLVSGASRIQVLGTFYGFTILMAEGAKPPDEPKASAGATFANYYSWRQMRRKRTWLDEDLNEDAAIAIKNLTGEFAQAVDIDRTYKTLGSTSIFKKRCQPLTAEILADAVRRSLYKAPTHRRQAARRLGRNGDSRALPFLHSRMLAEANNKTSLGIATALGSIGHASSAEVIYERVASVTRYSKVLVDMIYPLANIRAPETKEILLKLVEHKISSFRAAAIECLTQLAPADLARIVAPSLQESSKPIVRNSVIALSRCGKDGVDVLIANVPRILKVIGNDQPSAYAMERLLAIEGIGEREDVHEHFAKKLKKETAKLSKWVKLRDSGTYRGYFHRYIRRGLLELDNTLGTTKKYVKKPYTYNLSKELREAQRVANSARQT